MISIYIYIIIYTIRVPSGKQTVCYGKWPLKQWICPLDHHVCTTLCRQQKSSSHLPATPWPPLGNHQKSQWPQCAWTTAIFLQAQPFCRCSGFSTAHTGPGAESPWHLDLFFSFFAFHIAYYVDLFGGLAQLP